MHTKFLINSRDGKAWFSFQFIPKDPKYLSRPFAVISAKNPNMSQESDDVNKIKHSEMKKLLQSLHHKEFYPSVGELDEYKEECFVVYDISLEDAIEIGKKFDQRSIVFNNGKELSIRNCKSGGSFISYNHFEKYKSLKE